MVPRPDSQRTSTTNRPPVDTTSPLSDEQQQRLDHDDDSGVVAPSPKSTTPTTQKKDEEPHPIIIPVAGDDSPFLDFRTPTEWISFILGACMLVVVGPPVGVVVFAAMIWEAIDRGFEGGFVDSGKELTGFLFRVFVPWLQQATQTFNTQFVKRPQDAYMMNCIYAYGGIVPLLFAGCAFYSYNSPEGMTPLWVAFVYHLIRIGPYFMNFAYVYTLCHKEGHARAGLYAKPYNDSIFVRNIFNWWIGMFYGVLPATFAYGHSLNHHKYNNGPLDVITTSDKPRDNFANWVAYLPRYILYAINVSTIHQFASERNWKVVSKTLMGSIYFLIWCLLVATVVSPTFALIYVSFPFFEAAILLSAVNWSWHAFLNPNDPEDEYVQSITILDGCINVLNEDMHVVHHQVPGAHWTDHPAQVTKCWEQYKIRRASVFRKTHAFEVFGMVVARDYDALARKFVDLKGTDDPTQKLSHAETVALMKERTRGCWWGPRVIGDGGGGGGSSDAKKKKES